MKIKSCILITVMLGAASVASAYNHKWLGAASGAWGIGQNWTNNFPNPGENRAMRLFFPNFASEFNTIQDVDGLVVDYMDVSGPYRFNGGPGATLGFRDTNGLSGASVSLSLDDGPTFESDLTVLLTMPVGVWAQGTGQASAVAGYFNGPIAGTGEFHQYGTGRLEFGGSQANTYTGVTWVHSGELKLNKTGAVAIRGGLVVGVEGGSQYSSKVLFLQPSQLANTSQVTTYLDGWLDLNNHSQTIGSLTMTGGRISTGAGQLTLAGNVTSHSADAQALVEGRLGLGFVPRTFTTSGYTNQCLHITARIAGDSAASLVKQGPGSLILSGTNSYNGATLIQQGTVVARGSSPLGSAVQGTVVSDGATLHLESADLGDEPLTVSGVGVDGFAALFVFGSTTGNGPVTLPAPALITIYPGHRLTLNGVVSGPGGMDVILGGTLALGGDTANNYTGTTKIFGSSTLELRKRLLILGGGIGLTAVPGPLDIAGGDVHLYYDNQIADTAPVTFSQASGQLDLNGQSDTIGSLAGVAGQVLLGNGELTVGGNANSTIAAASISGAGGRLRKIGPSTLTLTGTNTHTGATTIEGGTLVLNGSQPTSAVIVKTNAILAGFGTVGTITSQGGIVSPGVGPGRLNSKGVAFDSTSIFLAELSGQFAGVSYDQLNVAGALHLSGCALDVVLNFAGSVGNQYTIIANDGSDAVIGTFAGKPEGATFAFGGATFQITYHGGDGNDVVLTQLTASTQDFAPVLAIESNAAGQALLHWTTNAMGFHVERASSLPANAWQPVPGVPLVIADRFTLAIPASTNAAFFRLAKP
jgi:autotransporter-associated beta strand protein